MKYLKIVIGVVLVSIVVVFAISAVDPPVAVIKVEAISHQDLADGAIDTSKYHSPSTGLKVVGKGELVYLVGMEAAHDTVTSWAWTLTPPAGSNAILDATNTEMVTFRPDTTGQFEVGLTITTAGGTADTTLTVTSAEYVGVGTEGGLNPSFAKGQCAVCHPDKEADWQDTGHATMFELAIDGIKSSYYRESCIECHTVGFNEDTEAVNGGFDDVATNLGWTFPDTLQDGNWDDIVTNFPDLAHVSNIQCENCHGPGSLHKGNKAKIDLTLDAGMCGRCHDELTHHVKNNQWARSNHATGKTFARGTSASCAPCHSGWGFVATVDPASDLDLKTGDQNISCAVCHDPHNAGLEHQVRTVGDVTLFNNEVVSGGGMGQLCMHCHISRRNSAEYVTAYHSHYGPHHGPQTDMLFGTNAITFGVPIPSSNHKNVVENTCVTCHMATPPATAENLVGEHTFSMHYDGGTPDDPSDDVDNVTACKTCHGPITSFADIKAKMDYDGNGVVESAQAEIKGMLHELGKLLPPLGDPAVKVVAADYDPTLTGLTPGEIAQRKLYLKAAYNYFFVEEDKSNGVHNYQYAMNLLKVAHKALTTGSLGAGSIMAITDVPNDQGKQVRVGWMRFGGDGIGNNPILRYALWRRVDDMAPDATQQNLAVYESFNMKSEELKDFSEGSRIQVAGTLWDFAGSVPAAGHEYYNAIAPTLFDSTAADGVHWSVFVVSGHTAIPALQARSAPDSGYSVDNLAPVAPANIAGKETVSGIELTWDDPVDEDFNFFAIYRGETAGFDPTAAEPIAKITDASYVDSDVMVGSTYYYRISAFDFAENESVYSREFSLMVTSVEGPLTETIPDDYILQQNYPNPFNPSTTISFGLKESGHVTLTVYNALGEEVLNVVDGQMEPGFHRAVVRAENLSSGIYFYKLQVNGFTSVKKLIVMK